MVRAIKFISCASHFDRKAKIKKLLQFISIPHQSRPHLSSVEICPSYVNEQKHSLYCASVVHQILSDESLSENLADGKVSEKSEIPSEYQALLEKYQKLLKTEFTATSKGKKVIHYIDTGHHKPCSAKLRPLMKVALKRLKARKPLWS